MIHAESKKIVIFLGDIDILASIEDFPNSRLIKISEE